MVDAGPRSAREPQGIQALPQREARADGTDYRRLTGEPDDLAQAVRRFDPGAVRAQQIRHSELTQLAGRPGHLRVRCREQVEAADHGVRSEEHTSELQSRLHLVCRLLLEKKHTRKDSACPATRSSNASAS